MTLRLSPQDIERYHRSGYLAIERLVGPDAVAVLREAYAEVIGHRDAVPGDRLLGGLTRQVMLPSRYNDVFDRNAALEAGREIGEQLLGEPVDRVFDMLIFKGPDHPHETPWHQDMAYAAKPFAAPGTEIPLETLQFWVALDDVDEETGCMHFVPGCHRRPLLEHRVAAGDPDDDGRLLALTDAATQLDLAEAVAVALPAGGCTIHSYGTPHYTPPNRSATRSRPAYIFNLAPLP